MAPTQYLNWYWLLVRKVLCHSHEGNLAAGDQSTNEFENYTFKMINASLGGPRVDTAQQPWSSLVIYAVPSKYLARLWEAVGYDIIEICRNFASEIDYIAPVYSYGKIPIKSLCLSLCIALLVYNVGSHHFLIWSL